MEVTTREELLSGLTYIHTQLGQLNRLMSRYMDLGRELREQLAYTGLQAHTAKIQTASVRSGGKLLLIALGSTIAAFYCLLSLLSGMGPGSALLFALPILILIFGGGRRKLKAGALIFLVAMILLFTSVLVRSAPPAATVILGVLLLAVLAGETAVILFYNGRYVVRKNQQADAHNAQVVRATDARNAEIARQNRQIDARRDNLMARYRQICSELMENTSSWFPPDYYDLEAVEHFIHAVRNHKVSTVPEMVREYDACLDRRKSHQEMEEINRRLADIRNAQAVSEAQNRERNELLRRQNAMLGMKFMQDQYNADRQLQAANQRHQDAMENSRLNRQSMDRNTDAVRNLSRTVGKW